MANKKAEAAAAGPDTVSVDVLSATVINRQIAVAGTTGVEVTEAVARRLLERGKVVLSEGSVLDLSGPLSMGPLPSDADGDGILDAGAAIDADTGKGGPPLLDGDAPGSGRFDPTEPPANAPEAKGSTATVAYEGLSPEDAAAREQAAADAKVQDAAKAADEAREAASKASAAKTKAGAATKAKASK